MPKSKSNGKTETYDDNVVVVSSLVDLPYKFIQYHRVSQARINHPNDKLYVYEGHNGYRIVAFSLQMTKPKEEEVADVQD